MDYNKEERVG